MGISAVAAPISGEIYDALEGSNPFVRNALSGLGGTTVRAALNGKVDIATVIADAFGNAIGNSIAEKLTSPRRPTDSIAGALSDDEIRGAIVSEKIKGLSFKQVKDAIEDAEKIPGVTAAIVRNSDLDQGQAGEFSLQVVTTGGADNSGGTFSLNQTSISELKANVNFVIGDLRDTVGGSALNEVLNNANFDSQVQRHQIFNDLLSERVEQVNDDFRRSGEAAFRLGQNRAANNPSARPFEFTVAALQAYISEGSSTFDDPIVKLAENTAFYSTALLTAGGGVGLGARGLVNLGLRRGTDAGLRTAGRTGLTFARPTAGRALLGTAQIGYGTDLITTAGRSIASGEFERTLTNRVLADVTGSQGLADAIELGTGVGALGLTGLRALSRRNVQANIRQNVLDNIAASQAANRSSNFGGLARAELDLAAQRAAQSSPVTFAESLQGTAPFLGIDTFREVTIKKGTRLFAGEPGFSGFFTTQSGFRRSQGDAQKLFSGLQVPPRLGKDGSLALRPSVAEFEVLQDVQAAFGIVRANPTLGVGGLPQVVIADFLSVVRQVSSTPLQNFVVRIANATK